jgi:predicted DNA-binding transcriptional regulator AlpA
MGISEIAERLEISRSYAAELAGRRNFPEPTRLKMGLVWATEDVEAWIATNRPPAAETN